MPSQPGSPRLQKSLGLRDVYTLATGATLSAGLFLLPGIAAQSAGPAIVFAYLLAVVPLVPAMLCIVELATAMPRAGGAYYFLDRSLGPLAGTIGGIGTWLALLLKTTFALVGIGAYSTLIFGEADEWLMRWVGVGFAVAFGILNAFGAKKTGGLQAILVFGLLVILALFTSAGLPEVQASHFEGFFAAGTENILATTGLVYISYVGVTKVASVAEEIRDPERNLPLGVFLSLATAFLVYGLCTVVLVGVIPMSELKGDMTPIASAADRLVGEWGVWLVSIGAFLAFASVSNAGILSSSRYPLAMGRDNLVPEALCRISSRGTPLVSIAVTVGTIVTLLLLAEPESIAKLASAFQLLMFALLCIAVIVMRESGLSSYDPGYKAPFYPWTQVVGIVAPLVLIGQMGLTSTLFSLGLIVAAAAWYFYYASPQVKRHGAVYHVFARLGEMRHEELDVELRTILKEKGLRDSDPFEEAVLAAEIIDDEEISSFDMLIERASAALAPAIGEDAESLARGFTEGTLKGATPVAKGVALPHMRLDGLNSPHLVIARTRQEIQIVTGDVFGATQSSDRVNAVFFLISPGDDPSQHLRMLAQLASRIDQPDFIEHWLEARNEVQLREIFLRDDRYLSLRLEPNTAPGKLAGQRVMDLGFPDESLVAAIRRSGRTIVPRGGTTLEAGDRLLVLGEPGAIRILERRFELRGPESDS